MTNLFIKVADFTQEPLAVSRVNMTPLFTYSVTDTSLITSDRMYAVTTSSGTAVFPNVVTGQYRLDFVGPYAVTPVQVSIAGTGTLNAVDLVDVPTTYPDTTVAYSKVQADARFAPISGGAGSGITANIYYSGQHYLSVQNGLIVGTGQSVSNTPLTYESVSNGTILTPTSATLSDDADTMDGNILTYPIASGSVVNSTLNIIHDGISNLDVMFVKYDQSYSSGVLSREDFDSPAAIDIQFTAPYSGFLYIDPNAYTPSNAVNFTVNMSNN